MNKNGDQIYLERLCKKLQSLVTLFNKRKPSSTSFTKAEIWALSNFNIVALAGLFGCVRRLQNQTRLIPETVNANRESTLYYLQLLLSSAHRLSDLLKAGDIKKLKAVQTELRVNDVTEIDRSRLIPYSDEIFEEMIVAFLETGDIFNDHIYENIAMLPGLFWPLVNYFLDSNKDMIDTQQRYDFLVISNYMLYGTKLEILQLLKLKNH